MTHLKNSVKALQAGNYQVANSCIAAMSTLCWEKNKDWIQELKRIGQFKYQLKK